MCVEKTRRRPENFVSAGNVACALRKENTISKIVSAEVSSFWTSLKESKIENAYNI